MKTIKYDEELFRENYLSVAQILMKLADPTFLWGELGRGSGKTTHIMSPRLDRVQSDMAGSLIVLGASSYKSIFDSILPGLMEYFNENYERGIYYEIGKEPPRHFSKCLTHVENWKHSISFCTGTVVQFVSCDRPDSMNGKNAAHLFADELINIPQDKFIERILPALRADRSKFGHSPYFMGITGFSSTPNFETDEDWFLDFEQNMDTKLMECIMEISYELDQRITALEIATKQLNEKEIVKNQKFIKNWSSRLAELKRGQTYYMRASSFSNVKILGVDYIENQMKNIRDIDKLYTSIFSIRKQKVKDMFFGRFGKQHLFSDGYNYYNYNKITAGEVPEHTSSNLTYCDPKQPLYAGYDPGPFSSIVFAQRKSTNMKHEMRVIKDMWVIHPEQHEELAEKINTFFANHKRKELFLHYDRAANQRDPSYRKYYPLSTDINDTDAMLIRNALQKRGWQVHLMSIGQPIIQYWQHYRLLDILFGHPDNRRDTILIDRLECEALVSSINHSPLKRTEGKIELDKSSEKRLEYKDQAFGSTQISTALMYLLWGEYNKLLPRTGMNDIQGLGSYKA